jgi:molybdopterin synthase sulfur carrier subunit
MDGGPGTLAGDETAPITVRYWASAREAAGVSSETLPMTGSLTVSDVVRRLEALHPDSRVPRVLAICSVLIGDRPVGPADRDDVVVGPGDTVEFLPPFAGG